MGEVWEVWDGGEENQAGDATRLASSDTRGVQARAITAKRISPKSHKQAITSRSCRTCLRAPHAAADPTLTRHPPQTVPC